MCGNRSGFTALEKLRAVYLVYQRLLTVSEVCDEYAVSRRTWYNWEIQLKAAIQPNWGGLARKS